MRALDLFAGAGGWDVACHWLGIESHGVEFMPAALETRVANGLSTAYTDVWDGLLPESRPRLLTPREREERERAMAIIGQPDAPVGEWEHALQIASPPCQTFSMAGKGSGRAALDDVLGHIMADDYRDPVALFQATQRQDSRTALVLTPLAHAWRDRPMFIAWEQVPTVQPVWDACAHVLRSIGYSVWTGKLNAEQYGVPQTRIRSVLIARRDGREAKPPVPTHSRYYSRDPKRLDPGVLPWVSMAQALGWGMTDRPGVTAGNAVGRGLIGGSGAKATVVGAMDAGDWIDSPHGDGANYGERTRITEADAGALQTFPTDTLRSNYGTSGDPANRGERTSDQPAATITSKANRNRWQDADRGMTEGEAAALQSFPVDRELLAEQVRAVVNDQSGTAYDPTWPAQRPALTMAGRDLVPHPGATRNATNGSTKSRNDGIVVTEDQAACIQSFPRAYEFRGTKSDRFLQIGNAVPPLLAYAILGTFMD